MPESRTGGVTFAVRGRMSKMISLGSRLAIGVAKTRDPKLFARYADMRKRYLHLKNLLISKYKPVGMNKAREIMNLNDK